MKMDLFESDLFGFLISCPPPKSCSVIRKSPALSAVSRSEAEPKD